MKRATFWTLPLLILISTGLSELFKGMRNEGWYRRKGDPVKARVIQIKDSAANEAAEPVWRLKATWTDPTRKRVNAQTRASPAPTPAARPPRRHQRTAHPADQRASSRLA